MKFYTNLKPVAFIAVMILLLNSCSNERYGHIQRGNAKAKDIAKIEKENSVPVTEATDIAPVTALSTEKTNVTEANTGFNASKAVKAINAKVVRNVFVKNAIKNVVNSHLPEIKYTAPYEFKKGSGTHKKHAVDHALLIILAIFLPPLAVGLASDWQDSTALIINILLTVFTCIGGIIHALIYVSNNR